MKKSLLFSAFALLFASSAFATHSTGIYAEANLGLNSTDVNSLGQHASSYSAVGINGNLGYQFTPYFAGEFGYTDYLSGLDISGLDVTGKLILPLGNSLYVFGKAGVTTLRSDSHSNTVPYTGLGAAFAITPSLDINIQTQGGVLIRNSVALLSTGLTYHF